MKKIIPRQDFVLIKIVKKNEDEMQKTKSGLFLPTTEMEKSTGGYSRDVYKFEVVDVGNDVQDIVVGDLVIFSDTYASSIKDDNDDLFILIKEKYVYATYED